jgi:hypothetical protein
VELASSGSRTFCATKPNSGGFIEEKCGWERLIGRLPYALEYDRSNITPRFFNGDEQPLFAKTTQ